MNAPIKKPRFLSTGQVARRLGFSDDTVRRRCEEGAIPGAFRLGGKGEWRIPSAWLDGILGAAGVLQ